MYLVQEEELARQTAIDAHRTAADARRARYAREQEQHIAGTNVAGANDVAIRAAETGDMVALMRLAELDSHDLPNGHVLVAEVDGQVRAALEVESGVAVANPFEATGHLVALLELRAQQVEPLARTATRKRRLLGFLSPRTHKTA
jgi:hypothetical protein